MPTIPQHMKDRGKDKFQLVFLKIQKPDGTWERHTKMDGNECYGYWGRLAIKKYITNAYTYLQSIDPEFKKITKEFKALYKACHERDVHKTQIGMKCFLPIDHNIIDNGEVESLFERYKETVSYIRELYNDDTLFQPQIDDMQKDCENLFIAKKLVKEGRVKDLKQILKDMIPLKDYMKKLYAVMIDYDCAAFNEILYDYMLDNRAQNQIQALLIFIKLIDKELRRKFIINEMRVLAFHHADKLSPRLDILLMRVPRKDEGPNAKTEFLRYMCYREVKKQGIRTTGKLAGTCYVFEPVSQRLKLDSDDRYTNHKDQRTP